MRISLNFSSEALPSKALNAKDTNKREYEAKQSTSDHCSGKEPYKSSKEKCSNIPHKSQKQCKNTIIAKYLRLMKIEKYRKY